MKHFKTKDHIKNRNHLRDLLNNPFKEPLASTIQKFLAKEKAIIINKVENCEGYTTRLNYTFRKQTLICYLNIFVSKDHLITVKINYPNKEVVLKTRLVDEIIAALGKCFI